MYQCQFGQYSTTGIEDNALKPYFEHFKVPPRPLKLVKVTKIQSTIPTTNKVFMQVWPK